MTTNKILAIKGKLSSLSIVLDDAIVISAILRPLPPSFENFLDNWQMLDAEFRTLDRFVAGESQGVF